VLLVRVAMCLVAGLLLYGLSRVHYVLFHTSAELFSIIVADMIYTLSLSSRKVASDDLVPYLGIAYLAVAIIDFFHTMAYRGMGVFPTYDANLPTQLWIAARYLESLSLLFAGWTIGRRLPLRRIEYGYMAIAALLLALIFGRCFPDCFIEGRGLTWFKRSSEYVIVLILLLAIWRFYRHRTRLPEGFYNDLLAALLCTIAAELSFTLYRDVYGVANLVGHYFKVISFLFIYQGLVAETLDQPLKALFTDLVASQKALQREHALLQDAIDAPEHPFYLVDIDTYRVIMANRAARAMGVQEGDFCHRAIHGQDRPCPENGCTCPLESIRQTGQPVVLEHIHITPDGERLMEVHGYPIRDSDGQITRAIEYAVDITERREMEERLREVQRLEAVGRLAGGIAHEFNNLLQVIRGHGDMLAYSLPADHPEQEDIGAIRQATQRAAQLVQRLLDFARRRMLLFHEIDINAVLRETLEDMRLQQRYPQIDLHNELAPVPMWVLGDERAIAQVLRELVDNAIKAMPEGGTLTVRTEQAVVPESVSLRRPDGALLEAGAPCYRWIVADTGIGMDAEVQAHLFEPFFTTRPVGQGIGLGLPAVYGVVKQIGGEVRVRTSPGEGTTVEILLPYATAPEKSTSKADN